MCTGTKKEQERRVSEILALEIKDFQIFKLSNLASSLYHGLINAGFVRIKFP